MTHASLAIQSHNLSGEEINSGSHTVHTFFITQGHGGPPRMRDQLNAEVTSETTPNMKDDTHHSHTHSF